MGPLDLGALLRERLAGATRVAVLGVGSELRADDIAGMRAAEAVAAAAAGRECTVLYGCTAPENMTGEVRKYAPSHLVIIDAADTGAAPGTIFLINPDDIAGISFSTHMMPLKILVDYVTAETKCAVVVIGIQPGELAFGAPVTPAVDAAAAELAAALVVALPTR